MNILLVSLGTHQVSQREAFLPFGDLKVIDWKQCCSLYKCIREVVNSGFIPDLTFMQLQNPGIISAEQLAHVPGIKVNWTGDVRVTIPQWYKDLHDAFDLTLFSNQTDVDTFKSEGYSKTAFLNIGFEESIYTPIGPSIESPYVFMGNNYNANSRFPLSKYRVQMANALPELEVYGKWWGGRAKGDLMSNPLKEAAIYRGCKGGINLSHFSYYRYTSDRLFRIMACGAFALTHHYPGIEDDFQLGVHLDSWISIDDLKDKMDYYSKNESLRQKIAKAGCKEVWENHTWKNRVSELLELVGLCE